MALWHRGHKGGRLGLHVVWPLLENACGVICSPPELRPSPTPRRAQVLIPPPPKKAGLEPATGFCFPPSHKRAAAGSVGFTSEYTGIKWLQMSRASSFTYLMAFSGSSWIGVTLEAKRFLPASLSFASGRSLAGSCNTTLPLLLACFHCEVTRGVPLPPGSAQQDGGGCVFKSWGSCLSVLNMEVR